MTEISEFTKAQALGNDFIIIDALKSEPNIKKEQVKKMCERRKGIGADGVLFLRRSEKADFNMQVYNSDGSEAGMCGNGIRCLARYVYERGIHQSKNISIETLAGIIGVSLEGEDVRSDMIKVDIGEPSFERQRIPMTGEGGEVVRENLVVNGEAYEVTCLSVGNPHCVLFVDDIKSAKVEELGTLIENLAVFPEKTNVEFVEVKKGNDIKMRVWERGAGETSACGTGAAATLVAAVKNNLAERRARILLVGGNLDVTWAENNRLYITGDASIIFSGKVDKDWFAG